MSEVRERKRGLRSSKRNLNANPDEGEGEEAIFELSELVLDASDERVDEKSEKESIKEVVKDGEDDEEEESFGDDTEFSEDDEDIEEEDDDLEDESENDIEEDSAGQNKIEIPEKYVNLAELSDSSDEEEGPLLRMGNVPREWYDDLDHLGYNIQGQPIAKKIGKDKLDQILDRENPKILRTVYDDENDRHVVLSNEQLMMAERLRQGKFPDAKFDETADYFYTDVEKQIHPMGNAMNPPKSSFIPSKWENKKVLKILNAMKNGWIKVGDNKSDKKEQEKKKLDSNAYLIWKDDGLNEDADGERMKGPPYIPAPKLPLPKHAESYNPPEEFLPTKQELQEWEDMDPEDRPHNFTPQKYDALRKVPGYENYVRERFDRCLDLYLCPRKMKNKLNIDPESLIPKLPDPSSLKPFPQHLGVIFRGHSGRVRSISVHPSGQWLASGSEDCTVRLWEVESGRCMQIFNLDDTVKKVEWNPKRCCVAAIVDDCAVILFPKDPISTKEDLIDREELRKTMTSSLHKRQLNAQEPEDGSSVQISKWDLNGEDRIIIRLQGLIHSFAWHHKGDYFSTVRADAVKTAVVIHRLSTSQSQTPFTRNKGFVQCVQFHPKQPIFLVATKTHIRVYDLSKQTLLKKLAAPVKWISSIDLHPNGDHLVLSSYDRKVCWFDIDLSSTPFKTLRYHQRGVRRTKFHSRYPLFLSASDDGNVHVFHHSVSKDFMQDPIIVPVKIIQAHPVSEEGLGVLDASFHPLQPWLFTAGTDSLIKLYN